MINRLDKEEVRHMINNFIGTISLSSEESINFLNTLLRPSQEILINRNKIFDDIDSSVTIKRVNDEFEADIDNLDLSFLDNDAPKKISIITTVRLNTSDEFCFENNSIDSATVIRKEQEVYMKISNSSYLNNAA